MHVQAWDHEGMQGWDLNLAKLFAYGIAKDLLKYIKHGLLTVCGFLHVVTVSLKYKKWAISGTYMTFRRPSRA